MDCSLGLLWVFVDLPDRMARVHYYWRMASLAKIANHRRSEIEYQVEIEVCDRKEEYWSVDTGGKGRQSFGGGIAKKEIDHMRREGKYR